MNILYIVFTSIGAVTVLFVLTKIMGNRQMSQLSMFDYINGITIGSIAAEMATALEGDFILPLIAMVVFTIISIIISVISTKSIRLRRILTGKALILLQDGKLFEGNLKKAHLDVNEFLTQCRTAGFFNISELHTAILESNGKISFLPMSLHRPATPNDFNLKPDEESTVINIIIDGKIMADNLKFTGNNEVWLKNELHAQGFSDYSEVFLATCDINNNLSVYVKVKKPMTRDCFE